jgi:hypothetical protein
MQPNYYVKRSIQKFANSNVSFLLPFDRQKSNNFLYLQVKIYGLGSDLWPNPKHFYSYFSKAVVEVKFISKYSGVIHSFHEEKTSSTFWYPKLG